MKSQKKCWCKKKIIATILFLLWQTITVSSLIPFGKAYRKLWRNHPLPCGHYMFEIIIIIIIILIRNNHNHAWKGLWFITYFFLNLAWYTIIFRFKSFLGLWKIYIGFSEAKSSLWNILIWSTKLTLCSIDL